MTITNPLLKATRAALTELTTSEAQAWYRATARATAASAMAITHKSIVVLGHLLRPKQKLLTGGGVSVPTAVADLPSPSVPFGWAAIEANDVAAVPDQEGDNTELLPTDESENEAIIVASVAVENEPSEEVLEVEGEELEADEEREGRS
jgi:hypothetical protein